MKLEIPYQNVTNKEDAFKKLKGLLHPDTFAQYGLKCDVRSDEYRCSADASGKGFDVNLECLDDKAIVEINLSFMLKPFKNKIADTIERKAKSLL